MSHLQKYNSSFGSFNTIKNMVSAGTGLLGGKFALQMRYSDLKSDGYIDRTGSDHRSAYISGILQDREIKIKSKYYSGRRTYRNWLVGCSERDA